MSRSTNDLLTELLETVKENVRASDVLNNECSLSAYASLAKNGVWTDALSTALREHETVIVPPSDTPYLIDDTVTIPSNRKIVAYGATFRASDGMDVLMLWTKPGADYVCIEPWTNAPDFESCDMNIEHKPGMIRLAPGANAVRRHFIEVI